MPYQRSTHHLLAAWSVVALGLVGCTDDAGLPRDELGGPPKVGGGSRDGSADRSGDAAPVDGGGRDGGDARDAGGTGGTPSGAGGTGGIPDAAIGGRADAGSETGAACETCEAKSCGDLLARCFMATGSAAAGRAIGTPKKELCAAVMACVRRTGCASSTPEKCYCGSADEIGCVSGKANGPCKMEIENGAETGEPISVAERFFDPSFATGNAFTVIQQCDREVCSLPCFGVAGGMGGSGGMPAMNGQGGAGGAPGVPDPPRDAAPPVDSAPASAPDAAPDAGVDAAVDATPDAGEDAVDAASDAFVAEVGPTPGGLCFACEQKQCPELVTECEQATGNAAGGPAAGMAKKQLCVGVLDCVKSTGCAATAIEECYCGAGVDPIACLTGGARGVCKAQFEAAAEETDPVKISERFVDPGFALGNANRLLQCDKEFCTPCPVIDGGLTTGPVDAGTDAALDVSVSIETDGPAASDAATPADVAIDAATDAAIDAATAADVAIAECADLDHNEVLDCRETLLAGSDFDNGVQGWLGEPYMSQAWDARDAQGNGHSGSMLVTNTAQADADGASMRGTRQCISATPGAAYRLFFQLFVPGGQGAGSAGLSVNYHASADCSGPAASVYTSPLVGGPDVWHVVTGSTTAPTEARSLSVRLVAIKPLRQPAFKVLFDNILIRAP